MKDTPNASEREFLYYLSRSQYEKEWGAHLPEAGFGTRLLAFVMRWIPKSARSRRWRSRFRQLETEDMYIKSIDRTVENYGSLLRGVRDGRFGCRTRIATRTSSRGRASTC